MRTDQVNTQRPEMVSVWVVTTEHDHENHEIRGVYSTEERANAMSQLLPGHHHRVDQWCVDVLLSEARVEYDRTMQRADTMRAAFEQWTRCEA